MKKIIFLIFIPFITNALNTRITLLTGGNYTDSSFDYLLFGFLGKLEFFDIVEGIGLGGSIFEKIGIFTSSEQELSTYELYLNKVWLKTEGTSYLSKDYTMLNLMFGIKKKYLSYINQMNEIPVIENYLKPFAGVEISSDIFGVILKALSSNDNKIKLEYEFKIKTYYDVTFQVGGTFGEKIFGVPSDFHFYSGIELFF